MDMDNFLPDEETEAERNLRHRAENRAWIEAHGGQDDFNTMWEISERHKAEWASSPCAETAQRRASERDVWALPKSEGSDEEAAPKQQRRYGRRGLTGNTPLPAGLGGAARARRGR